MKKEELEKEKEDYPQLILTKGGKYAIYIAESTCLRFTSDEAFEEFLKNNKFNIKAGWI